MSSFTTPLICELLDDGVSYKIHERFTFRIGSETSQRRVETEVGFITDLASTWPFGWLIPPNGKYGKAAVTHDDLCKNKRIMNGNIVEHCTRKEADAIFLEAMTVLGVSKPRRLLMYSCVRGYAIATGKK